MKSTFWMLLFALVACSHGAGASKLAIANLSPRGSPPLTVQSPAFSSGGDIPYENTQYRGNVFPGLSWSAGPSATLSYAVVMQDPDGMRDAMPILHWTMFNVPASLTKLDAAMSAPPGDASYGPNMHGLNQAYAGPRTPPGRKHHYHLQVFALDTTLPAAAGASYADLLQAMKGHVLSSGELIGLAQADPNAH